MTARKDGLEIVVLRHDVPATKGSRLKFPNYIGKLWNTHVYEDNTRKSDFRFELVERRATETTVLKRPDVVLQALRR
jgi:hypothetical protein